MVKLSLRAQLSYNFESTMSILSYLWSMFDSLWLQSDGVHGCELHAREKIVEFVLMVFVRLELICGAATAHAGIGEVASTAQPAHTCRPYRHIHVNF